MKCSSSAVPAGCDAFSSCIVHPAALMHLGSSQRPIVATTNAALNEVVIASLWWNDAFNSIEAPLVASAHMCVEADVVLLPPAVMHRLRLPNIDTLDTRGAEEMWIEVAMSDNS